MVVSTLTEKLYGDLRGNFFDGFLRQMGTARMSLRLRAWPGVPVRRRTTAEPRTGTDQRVLLSFGSFGWTIAFRGCSDVVWGVARRHRRTKISA